MDKKVKNTSLEAKRSVKMGGYSLLIAAAAIAIAVFLNLLVSKLPTKYTKLDTSTLGLYSISEESENVAKGVSEDVTIYMISSSGKEDSTIKELVERYTGLNSKITLKMVDPALYPSFVSGYTDKSLSESSLIFESAKRTTAVDYNDIYVTEYSYDSSSGGVKTSSSFAGEARITSALEYVTTDDIPKVYTLEGHGETAFSETMSNYLADDNYEVVSLSLLSSGTVPEDADALIINMPTSDINSDEADAILQYMGGGGNVVLITGYGTSELPNVASIGEYYGIHANWGLVIEGSSNNYYGYPYFLLPKVGSHAIVSAMPSDSFYVMLPYAMGLTVDSTLPRATVSVTKLLYTSGSAYLKAGEVDNLEKADGDVTGEFVVAAAATEGTSKFVWFSSPYITDETIDSYVSGANSSFFLSTMMWLAGKTQSTSIATKPMQVAALVLTETASNVWGAVITFIIPAAVMIVGLRVWLKRRKS